MLDINLIRNNPDLVKKNLEKRNQLEKIKNVDLILKYDKEWKQIKQKSEELKHRRNLLSEEINKAKKEGKNISKLLKEAKEIPEEIKKLDEKQNKIREKIDEVILTLPNILHEKVPYGKDTKDNVEIRKWGKIKEFNFELLNHAELAEKLNIADFDQGREVAGQGFNYLFGGLAVLDLALQRYGVEFLLKRKFKLVVPPIMLRKESIAGTIAMHDFENIVYKIENENLYLIGTAEHSLVSMFMNKILKKENFPIKVCSVTPCFRREIGAHGVDTKGLFRMHQFNKVEQVIVSSPEDSFKTLEEMQSITEEFFKSLEIPFRVVEICSGDLGMKFAKQYDIETWMPRQKQYQEVTSAGNCTDYQARALNIKYYESNEKKFPHILNNTMVATSRAMVAILENFQEKDGSVKIPKVLHSYCGFKEISMKK